MSQGVIVKIAVGVFFPGTAMIINAISGVAYDGLAVNIIPIRAGEIIPFASYYTHIKFQFAIEHGMIDIEATGELFIVRAFEQSLPVAVVDRSYIVGLRIATLQGKVMRMAYRRMADGFQPVCIAAIICQFHAFSN